jgi:hypothetical protein
MAIVADTQKLKKQQYYLANRAAKIAAAAAWKAANPDKVRASNKKRNQTAKRKQAERERQTAVRTARRACAGNGDVCCICGKPEQRAIHGKVISLAVDHNDDTGQIRGLLCATCNCAIGGLRHSPQLLAKAIEYLLTHDAAIATQHPNALEPLQCLIQTLNS